MKGKVLQTMSEFCTSVNGRSSRLCLLLVAIMSCFAVSAQTDMTSRITNPSFEQDAEGWTQKGMSVQGNSVFNIKDGSKYMER